MTLVGYPGPAGSHSAAATALLAPPGAGAEPLSSFIAVVEATVGAEVALGVLPIENSLHGPVGETHDLLYEAPVSIVSEVTLPVIHHLVAKTAMDAGDVRTIRSHPAAFDQCRDLIHSLSAGCIPTSSTSSAALEVAESDDPFDAAISSREAADHYGLKVIAEDVGDRPAAFTRFVAIAPYTRVDRATALAHGAVVRHGPSAGLALPRARAVSPPRPEPGAARLAPDPALDVPLPVRHGARRAPAGRRGEGDTRRDARVDARDQDLRKLRRNGGPLSETTLFEKIWEAHVVDERPGEPALLYIDLHLVHEVTSPQAFESLRLAGRPVRRPDLTIATMDHNVPTELGPIRDPLAKAQLDALAANCAEFGVPLNATGSGSEGIVHVMGPELGLTQPGMTIVCGDSHTSTHGAFGALAFGIGTSEVEHVLATQTLIQSRPKTMRIRFVGELPFGVTAKDMVLGAIGRIGVAGGVGSTIEFAGPAVEALSMEGRMTICNMTIEGGARAGMIAPDDTTFAYIEGRPGAPKGAAWEKALDAWRALRTDPGATFDREVEIDVAELVPQVTWGTNPGMVAPISSMVPDPASYDDPTERRAVELALGYMGLEPGTPLSEIPIDRVFIGSCTNSRIEDLRAAADVVSGRHVAGSVRAMVVPGSAKVKRQAEDEGLDRVFTSAGFEWREAGCSMCLGMNPDILAAGERCASTSNRNFEGRQGAGGRTHLVSPQMAAAAAITGHFTDVRELG